MAARNADSDAVTPTATHRLEPLFNPRSVAIVGASGRAGRPGNDAVRALRAIGFEGPVWPVNPNYQEIEGFDCFPEVAALPAAPDLAVIAGATERMEAQLADAIRCGARSALLFAHGLVRDDTDPPILERIAAMARAADLPLAGPYTIGYVNYGARCAAVWVPPIGTTPGPVAGVLQSGATFATVYNLDPRLHFNFIAHPGQEAVLTLADYMDYALALPSTRVLGVYLESVRAPDKFIAALELARAKDIPVVVLKAGRGERSAELVLTHSGALAGDDAAFQAVFDRYGVLRVHTMDEWLASLQMMAHPRRPGPGALAAITDSGGQRNVLFDLADDIGLDWAAIGPATEERLAERLALGLLPMNPLDAWGAEPDWIDVFRDCFQALLEDPATAIGVLFSEFGVGSADPLMMPYIEMLKEVAAKTEKPVVSASFSSRQIHGDAILELDRAGIPSLDGGREALRALKHALDYRDYRVRPSMTLPPAPNPGMTARWRDRLAHADPLEEAEGLCLLADFDIPIVPARTAETVDEVLAAASVIGYPVALKTAMPGIAHKTEVGGVELNLPDAAAVRAAYADLGARLGPRVLVAAMAPAGVEVALGIVNDAQFGPLVMVGAGGLLVELLKDRRFAVPPVDAAEARRMIETLKIAPLLRGARGRPPSDFEALAETLSRLSVLAGSIGDSIAELDINPVIAGPEGCVVVDALVVPIVAREVATQP